MNSFLSVLTRGFGTKLFFVAFAALFLAFAMPSRAAVNLQFYTSPSYSVSSTGTWGGPVSISMSVINDGATASGGFTVSLYLSPTATYNASTAYAWVAGSNAVSFPSLGLGQYTGLTNASVNLPASIPTGLGSGTPGSTSTVYVIALISQNGLTTSKAATITTSAADIIGYKGQGLGFAVQTSPVSWGGIAGIEWAVANQAAGTAGPFTINLYLCETPTFGSGNVPSVHAYYLTSINVSSGLPGGYIEESVNAQGSFGYENIQLPSANPFGDSNTSFYIGMVINPTTNNTLTPITESNLTNDCDQGSGIDYAPLTINPPQPAISVVSSSPAGSTTAVQFSSVNIGTSANQTVTITDTGAANLNVTNVTANGPYTVTNVVSSIQNLSSPYFPGVIAPESEESWVVTVQYTPTAAALQTGTLTITSNDPTHPTETLTMTGTGGTVPNLVFGNPVPLNNDNLIANFGSVPDNGSMNETFTLSNNGTAPLTISQNGIALTDAQSGAWSIVSITSSTQGAISLSSASKMIAANSAETWTVVVKLTPTAVQSYATGLQIFSNDPSTPTTSGAPTMTCALQGQGVVPMTLVVTSSVNGTNDANPLIMNFGSVHATGQQTVSGTITLTNNGQLPLTIAQNGISLASGTNFQITSITSSTQGTISLSSSSATIAGSGAETWTIGVTFTPTVTGNDNTTLTIASNDPTHGTEPVTLEGTGLNQSGIVITTPGGNNSLAFGPVLNDGAGGHVGTQTFTIQNIGLQPLVISQNGITATGSRFSVQSIISSVHGSISLASGSASIAAKEAETWTVTAGFDPTTNTSSTGTISVASNDPVNPSVSVALSGSGTTPTLTLNPTSGGATAITIDAGQVYNITWTAADTSDTAGTATLTLSSSPSNTLPASNLTTIATIPFNSTTTSYAWRPSASLVGQTVYVYGNLQDQGVSAASFAAQQYTVEAAGSFNALSPLTTTTSNYVYTYLFDGKVYSGSTTLQPGNNVINITTPVSGGGSIVHQIDVTDQSSLLATQGYTYDEMNRIKTYSNGNGIVTTYTYDTAGDLVKTSASNGDVITYTYDALKHRASMSDNTGTIFYTCDDLNRVTALNYSQNNVKGDSDDIVVGYQYDLSGQITGINYPGGEQVNYGYDHAGRLTTVQDVVNASTTYNYTYTYNPTTGLLQTLAHPNGITTSYAYDGMGRLDDVKHVNSSNHTLAEYHYTLDANGNATALLTTFNNGSQKQETYAYDSLQRLVQVVYGAGAVAIPNTDKTVVYSYDNNGNRLTQTTTISGTVTQALQYSYGSENRLTQVLDQNGNQVASYVYDQAGNRIEKISSSGNTYYTYDERNLLTATVTPTDYDVYTYNGDGQRVSTNLDGTATQVIIDPTVTNYQNLQERVAGAVSANNVFGLAERLQTTTPSGSPKFYLGDRLGSIHMVTDVNGNILTTYAYDAFGAQQTIGN